MRPIATGTNNRSYLVSAGQATYVLKRYSNVGIKERLPFEHALLTALTRAGLPFAVPVPMPTISGETSPSIRHDGETWQIALFPHISGRAAAFGNAEETERCGSALAMLDEALEAVRLDPSIKTPETFGPLSAVHELILDPRVTTFKMFGSGVLSSTLIDIMARVEHNWEVHTRDWHPQLIHGDFYPSNTLIDAGRVIGILDFEFAGTGYKAMDFAIGLAAFSTKDWEVGPDWQALEAFAAGYLARSPLTTQELSAIPLLWMVREATSFTHFLGRMEQGITPRGDIEARAHRLLTLDRWVTDHQVQLVDRLRQLAQCG